MACKKFLSYNELPVSRALFRSVLFDTNCVHIYLEYTVEFYIPFPSTGLYHKNSNFLQVTPVRKFRFSRVPKRGG